MTAVLELEAVGRTHPGPPTVDALRAVSLRIERGELVAVVGPSGSGKSTLLHLLGTLERPSTGEVRVSGEAVSTLSDRRLSALRGEQIGFVFQQFLLVPTLSALDNVATALLYRGVPRAERRARAAAALTGIGLGQRLSHRPAELSGGEQQRVALARATVGRPAVVLADEPTGNLDTSTGAQVIALLRSLHTTGTTVVVVTHDHDLAASLPRQISLRNGEVVDDTAA